MEVGMVPKIDQFSDNKALDIQKVQSSAKSSEVTNEDKLEQITQEAISKQKEVSEANKVEKAQVSSASSAKFEVVLANTNFGYNDSSKDFYVKVERGNSENQYPTEDMMRLKAYLLTQDTQESAS